MTQTSSEIDQLIRALHAQGKEIKEIADFLEVTVLKVKGIVDKDHIRKKKEAIEGTRFRKALMRQKIVYADKIPQPNGAYLSTAEGEAALARIRQGYKPTGKRC